MPLIEVYARWRDKNDTPQRQFITSVSSPAGGLSGRHMETWLKDAVAAADHIERAAISKAEGSADERAGRDRAKEGE